MKAMLDRWSAIVCAKETHINVYEAGAFEYTLWNKILFADSDDGKLTSVFDLHYWNEETKAVRIASTANTNEETVDRLVSLLDN